MATSKEFHDYIMENLQRAGVVSSRKMMGEYIVYYQDKLVGMICDNCFFLKPTEKVLQLLPDNQRDYPYEGCKTLMVMVEEVEDKELMSQILREMYLELPEPNKKPKKRKSGREIK